MLWFVTSPCHSGRLLTRAKVRLRSCFVVRFGIGVAIPPKQWCRLAAVSAALGCVLGGQQAPLNADTYVLIERSTRLVDLLCSSRACAVPQQARPTPSPRSPLATVRRRTLCVMSCPSCSFRAAPSELFQHCRRRRRPPQLHRAPPCSKCFAFFPLVEVLSIVLGEWLTSKMAVQFARNLRLCIVL